MTLFCAQNSSILTFFLKLNFQLLLVKINAQNFSSLTSTDLSFVFCPIVKLFFFCFEIFFVRIIIFFRYLFFVFKQNDKKLDYLKRSAFHIKYFKSWYLHKRGGGPLAKLFSKGKFYSRKNSFLPKRNSLFCYVKEL